MGIFFCQEVMHAPLDLGGRVHVDDVDGRYGSRVKVQKD